MKQFDKYSKQKAVRDVYEIFFPKGNNKDDPETKLRNFINNRFHNYTEKILKKETVAWKELTLPEQEYFLYEYIRQDILLSYKTDAYAGCSLEEEIEEFVHARHFPSEEDLLSEIRLRDNCKANPNPKELNKYKRKTHYEQYCNDLKAFQTNIKVPEKDEWKATEFHLNSPISSDRQPTITIEEMEDNKSPQKNKKRLKKKKKAKASSKTKKVENSTHSDINEEKEASKTEKVEESTHSDINDKKASSHSTVAIYNRVYDAVMDANTNFNENFDMEKQSYLTEQTQKAILSTIIAVLRKKFKIQIDFEAIQETLNYLYDHDVDSFDELFLSYNPALDMTKEEQEKIIYKNLEYIYYKKKLEKSDFYSTVEEDDDEDDDEFNDSKENIRRF